MRQQGGNILDLVEDHRPAGKAPQKTGRIDSGKFAFERIVETYVGSLIAGFLPQERGLARLPWTGDEDGRKPGKGLTQSRGKLARLIHLTILKMVFSFVNTFPSKQPL